VQEIVMGLPFQSREPTTVVLPYKEQLTVQDVFDAWAANEDFINEAHHFWFYRDGSLVDASEPLTDQPIHFLPMLMGAAPKKRSRNNADVDAEAEVDPPSRQVFLHAALTALIVPIPSDDRMRSSDDRFRPSDDRILVFRRSFQTLRRSHISLQAIVSDLQTIV
jgi:hypothetical protein